MNYQPTLKVEIAFASAPDAASPTYTDVSAYVRRAAGAQLHRGRSSEFDDVQPGSVTFALNNRDRRFDPQHSTGPFFGQLLPGKKIRVSAVWTGVVASTYTLFVGFIDSWPQSYVQGNVDATVVITAFDQLAVFNEVLEPDPTFTYVMGTVGSVELYLRNADGTTWSDVSGHARHATRANVPSSSAYTASSSITPGLSSTGVGGGLWALASAVNLGTTYSIALWFTSTMKSDPSSAVGSTSVVFTQDPLLPAIELRDDGFNGIYGVIDFVSTGTFTTTSPGSNYNDGNPHHVVVTVNNATILMYIDGVAVTAASHPAATGYVSKFDLTDGSATSTSPTASSVLQEVICFSKVINATDVVLMYRYGLGQFLGDCGLTALRMITNAGISQGVTSSLPAVNCLDYVLTGRTVLECLREVAATSGGRCMTRANGGLSITGRYDYLSAASTVTFADDGSGVPFVQIATDLSKREVVNSVIVTASQGIVATAADATSATAYGHRSKSYATILATLSAAQDYANFLLASHKDAVQRLSQPLETKFGVEAFTTWGDKMLSLEIGSRVTLKYTPMKTVGAQIATDLIVEGITWNVDQSGLWTLLLDLAPVPGGMYATLDSATLGVLDAMTLAA